MRILQVANWYMPEHGYQEYFLADAWERMGHKVLTIAGTQVYPREGYGEFQLLAERRTVPAGLHRERGTDVWRLPCLELRNRVVLSTNLESVARRFEPDRVLVHGLTTFNALRMARLKKRTQKPFRLICDDHLLSSNVQNGIKGKLFYAAFRRLATPALLRSVDVFAPVSGDTLQIMQGRCGIPSERMSVIPLGVDVSRFRRDDEKRRSIRDELGVGPEEVLIVFAGKLLARKGIVQLIDAAIEVLKTDSGARLLIIGSGHPSYVRGHKERVEAAGLTSRVIWQAFKPNEELPGYFSAADIGVWPQGHSLVIPEAAACGVPIICQSTSYHREWFANGAAYLFDSYDRMLSNLHKLIANSELRHSAGVKAREAAEIHSWDQVAARYLEA